MKNKIIVFITAVLFSSCADSFLDLSDSSTLSPDNFPVTMDHMESLSTACYAQVIHINLYGCMALTKGAFVSDHTVDMAWTTDEHWSKQAQNQLEPNNGNVATLWDAYYKVVSAANTLLDCIDNFKKDGLTDVQLKRLSQMKGEGLFWRGWAHQQLVQYWGEGYPCNGDGDKLGVPLRLSASMTPASLKAKRNTVDEVYSQVLTDYKNAVDLLPEKWDDSNLGRSTKWAVQSYIGQLNLYKGDWKASKDILKDVIDKSGYQLLPFEDYKNMFNDNQIKFNKESILELNFIKGHTPGGYGNWAGAVSQMHSSLIAHCYRYGRDTKQGGWSNLFFHDSNIERFGDDPRLKICAIETARMQVSYDNILEWLYSLCETIGGSANVRLDGNTLKCDLFSGTDRSLLQDENPHIVFSDAYNNLLSFSYAADDAVQKNFAYVLGCGEGNARKRTTFCSGTEPTYLDRYEVYVDERNTAQEEDVTDAEYLEILKSSGAEHLVQPKTASESAIAAFSTQYQYNKDYFVGDYAIRWFVV